MSEKTPKSRWDTARQRWIHPDLPTAAVSKRKVGRPRNNHQEQITNPSGALEQVDERYNFAIAQVARKHKAWEMDQERKYGSITFRDEQGNLVRDEQGKLVIGMSERFTQLLLTAKDEGDLVPYPAGDPRGFVQSTDENQNFGWKDADAAAKYGAEIQEIPARSSEDAVAPTVEL